jgi:hypothetical protein
LGNSPSIFDMVVKNKAVTPISRAGAKVKLHTSTIGRILLISLFVTFIASGCTRFAVREPVSSYAGRELPIYTNDQLPIHAEKITASYDIKAFGPGGENAILALNFDKEIQKILPATPVFAALRSRPEPEDYHYSFVLRNEVPAEPLVILNAAVSGLTLTIIPAFERDIYILTIDVKRGCRVVKTYFYKDHTVDVKQGCRVVRTYSYRDHMDSWMQLFFVFSAPAYSTSSVSSLVIDNMIMNFTRDFSNDVRSGVYIEQKR